MLRRSFLQITSAVCCAWAASVVQAHTPFQQWVVYRRKHLLIGCHKEDLETYALAQQLVEILDKNLPAAKARIARAPTPGRLASLLGTDQLDVALISQKDAVVMADGKEQFKPYGKISLNTLFAYQKYVLVGRTDIPVKHGWLIAHALETSSLGATWPQTAEPPLPWHSGVRAYRDGESVPVS